MSLSRTCRSLRPLERSRPSAVSLMEFLIEPPFRLHPIAPNGARIDTDHLGRLFLGESAEKATLDDTGKSFVNPRQPCECLVERYEDIRPLFNGDVRLIQGNARRHVAALGRVIAPGVVDQDAAHDRGGDAEKVRPVPPLDAGRVDEPNVRLVDECRCTESVARVFPAELRMRDSSQLVVDEAHEAIHRFGIAMPPSAEELRDFVTSVHVTEKRDDLRQSSREVTTRACPIVTRDQ